MSWISMYVFACTVPAVTVLNHQLYGNVLHISRDLKLFLFILGDDVRTCRDLPPLLLPQDYKCKNFIYSQKEYFHVHGGEQAFR